MVPMMFRPVIVCISALMVSALAEVLESDGEKSFPDLVGFDHNYENETLNRDQGEERQNTANFWDSPILKPVDCAELRMMGYYVSGVYNIWPKNKIRNDQPLQVYCDMFFDLGGWTVIQRRGDYGRPKNYFYKNWANYKNGFGDIERDFWLGNDNIFALTNQKLYSVRFELVDVNFTYRYALYDTFFIHDEEDKYRLTIEDYSGNANDSMISAHNGQQFSTWDQDNDLWDNNCARVFKGGWWYSSCHQANLNGYNYIGTYEGRFADGIVWSQWRGLFESLLYTEIKIRPKDFRKSKVPFGYGTP